MTTHFKIKPGEKGVKSGIFESFEFVVREPEREIKAVKAKRNQLIKDLDEQILIASNRAYKPVKYKWRADSNGNIRRISVPIKLKKWWTETLRGKVQISVFYKGKVLELKDGRNAIQIDSVRELVSSLELLRLSVQLGDFDDLM